MHIHNFTLLQWCEIDLIIFSSTSKSDNAADGLTKPLAKIMFRRHMDTLLGHRLPTYITYCIPGTTYILLLFCTCLKITFLGIYSAWGGGYFTVGIVIIHKEY